MDLEMESVQCLILHFKDFSLLGVSMPLVRNDYIYSKQASSYAPIHVRACTQQGQAICRCVYTYVM